MKQYSRIFKYLSPYKGNIALYFLFILLSIVFSIVSIGMLMPFLELIFTNPKPGCAGCSTINETSSNPVIQAIKTFLLSSVASRGKIPTLGFICLLMLLFVFLKNIFLYFSYYILNPLKNRVVNQLREDLYDKVLRLPIGFFNEKRKGDLMSRMTSDVAEVENSVVGTLEGWFRDPMTIIVTLVVLFLISPQLTLFLLLLIPVLGLVIGRITRSLKQHSQEVAGKYGETLSTLDETLGGLRVIKAFNIERLLRDRFFRNNNDLLTAKNKISYRRDLASPLSEVMGVGIFCAILYYGGRLVLNNEIALEASAFIGYLGIFYNLINPAKALSTSFGNMRKGTAAIGRIEEILNTPVTVDDNPNGKIAETFHDKIEFRNVMFAYNDTLVLDNISLTINKGKTIALVGSSGAGKSTLADLIPRFHDVTGGEVRVDGLNIKDYSLQSLRSQMSIVTQEPILFNDTIANNIRMGKPDATMEEVINAAKVANAHHFIEQKENGYDANIGDRGSKLSGGEKQRLTIARAVLKNPPILILDEATSSLDTESERLVQDAINNLMQNRTSIVIAHRLSTVRHADEIIVLQKGTIAERGKHEELIAQNGIYKKLVELQEVK
jgi:ATP-binding cassette, subfamily B, bacterial MsbA